MRNHWVVSVSDAVPTISFETRAIARFLSFNTMNSVVEAADVIVLVNKYPKMEAFTRNEADTNTAASRLRDNGKVQIPVSKFKTQSRVSRLATDDTAPVEALTVNI
ncbi:MAG: hypothetical protein JXR76_06250 [Deltaproteobacteria bacterium]|nr:hypothetical protein [Deltaproteobacteria bacterium]